MQDDPGYLGPISAVPLGIEQAQIGHEMRLVINRDVGTIRGLVIDIRIKFRASPAYRAPSFPPGFLDACKDRERRSNRQDRIAKRSARIFSKT